MTRPEHWEPPDPPKILVSSRRVAEELDISLWKANEICWALDRRFYAKGQVHYRVTRRSLDTLKRLVEAGLSPSESRDILVHYKHRHEPVPLALDLDALRQQLRWLRARRRW